MDVDTGESAISIALGASATGTVETIIVGGLKYSSSKDWNKEKMELLKISNIVAGQLPQMLGFVFRQTRFVEECEQLKQWHSMNLNILDAFDDSVRRFIL
ncbi:hypothetical protein Tco_0850873 [Tanacetum coccineum]